MGELLGAAATFFAEEMLLPEVFAEILIIAARQRDSARVLVGSILLSDGGNDRKGGQPKVTPLHQFLESSCNLSNVFSAQILKYSPFHRNRRQVVQPQPPLYVGSAKSTDYTYCI